METPWRIGTQPVSHDGNFFNVEMYFNQDTYTVLPSRKDVNPGMVLLFELFLRGETYSHMDQALGWAFSPLCDNSFDIVEGKFKCPVLRGHYGLKIDRFHKIEELICSDLDRWLCNLYFQIIKPPLTLDGLKEREKCFQPPRKFMKNSETTGKEEVSDLENPSDPPKKMKDKPFHLQSGFSSMSSLESPQEPPLTSLRDPDTYKGSIPTAGKEVERPFNATKGEEENLSKESGGKRDKMSLKRFQQAEESEEENKPHGNDQTKLCKKGIAPHKLSPNSSSKDCDLIPVKDNGMFCKVRMTG
ncbi:uncharacterized protein LOC119949129 [Tachyglossus aculeatus]|uniref:uncharacterized protein LOC119949129 n=1 Tax=Tachyglossus aculeatus TaxID=9261 RepID=UPI0018F69F9B|nr:uncharacterized protein LOC119949129 [Tachyglossus aculeatus]